MRDFIRIPEERLQQLKKDKKEIEEFTKTKITINDEVSIDGESLNVFQTKQVLKAFGRGFETKDCLNLLEDEYGLEIIDLSQHARSKNRLKTLKGRIIGTGGKTKKFIEKYTHAKISIFGKTVSIIGKWNEIKVAKEAIMMLIGGSSHQTLYRWLEKQNVI